MMKMNLHIQLDVLEDFIDDSYLIPTSRNYDALIKLAKDNDLTIIIEFEENVLGRYKYDKEVENFRKAEK